MAGYSRVDTANNIANGNVIDADDFDAEYNAVEAAFNASSGHTHDGSSGEGAAITKVGPSQDIIVSATQVLPKSNNIIDLGSDAAEFKDGYFDGTVYADTTVHGTNGRATITDNAFTVSSGDLTLDVAGNILLDTDGGDVKLEDGGTQYAALTNNNNELDIYSGTTKAIALSGADISALGDLAVTTDTTVGGTLSVVGNTSVSSGNFTVNTGNVSIGGTLGVTGTITGTLSGTVSSLSNHDTDDVAEGSTNLYYTDTRAKAAISVTDAGGDGSLTYSAGAITYTGPSVTEARAHFSGGTGVTYSGGEFSIGQAVGTSDNVTFNNTTVDGNLIVNGTTTTVNSNDVNIGDATLTLNSDETGTPSQDAGITIERGTADNKSFLWDESEDEWTVGSEHIKAGTFEGALTGSTNGTHTGAVVGGVTGNLVGNVTGNLVGNVTGNADTATQLATARTITLSGDVSGSTSFDGTGNVSITATVADDSHNHTLSNIDGITVSEAEINSVDGVTSNIQAQINAVSALATQGVPSGAVQTFAMSTAPTGWIKANGSAVSRTTYSALFSAIGTTFGTGNGSTTFNVPDLRGEFARGWDDSRGIDTGRSFGSSQADAFKEHRHTLLGNSGGAVQALFSQSSVIAGIQNLGASFADPASTMGNGNGAGTETRPRNIALLYCIKT